MNIVRGFVCGCIACAMLSLSAAWEEPGLIGWSGTGYRPNGWFTYQMKESYANGSLKFESGDPFVLSPRYPAPIRKIVLKIVSKSDAPTRFLQVRPLVDGTEVSDLSHSLCGDVPAAEIARETSFVESLDFSLTENITAFLVSLGSGNKGNWAIEGLCVFYGEKASGEDAKLLEYAQQLPTPEKLRIVDFTLNSLSVATDPVSGAEGYRFELFRLDGVPRTVRQEDFISVSTLSAGWTFGVTNNVVLDQATGTSYPDTKTADDGRCLRLGVGKSATDLVQTEIISPLVVAPIVECSFVSKLGSSGESSDTIAIYGRSSVDAPWTALGNPTLVSTTKQWTTNAVPVELDVRQVKFEFTADAATCRNCGLDTLRVVYGGNEKRESVRVQESASASATAEFTALETARYAVRAQTVGGESGRDSSWTEEQVVDLSWFAITVDAPEDVVCEQSGSRLIVSWQPVAGADSYRVELAAVDDADGTASQVVTTSATSVRLELPSVGQYAATVFAVSPGGKFEAAAVPVFSTAVLSAVTDLSAEAVDRTTLRASWKAVPLAERYQVRLIRLGGDVRTFDYGWPTDGDACALPDGWGHATGWAGDYWTSGGTVFPSLPYTGCWISSSAYDRPVTRLVCKYKCASTAAATIEATRFVVSVSGLTGDWTEETRIATTAALQELVLDFDAARDIRRIRLAAESVNERELGKVAVGALFVTTGTETRTEASSVSVNDEEVTFRDLESTGRYQVSVTPQPSDGESLMAVSPTVDFSQEKFRAVGAIPVSQIKGGIYLQDFSCFTNVIGDLEARKADLDYWQFYKGSGETEKLLYTSATNRTTGGVYVFADSERTVEGFALGTLATSTLGCSVGVAFLNDTGRDFSLCDFTFDWIQRTARTGFNTNVLECLVTDGATGIGTEGTWITLATLVPLTAGEFWPEGGRRRVVVADPLPLVVPAGKVLVVRWRHEKGAAGPMMEIDNVRLTFPDVGKGFRMIVR